MEPIRAQLRAWQLQYHVPEGDRKHSRACAYLDHVVTTIADSRDFLAVVIFARPSTESATVPFGPQNNFDVGISWDVATVAPFASGIVSAAKLPLVSGWRGARFTWQSVSIADPTISVPLAYYGERSESWVQQKNNPTVIQMLTPQTIVMLLPA